MLDEDEGKDGGWVISGMRPNPNCIFGPFLVPKGNCSVHFRSINTFQNVMFLFARVPGQPSPAGTRMWSCSTKVGSRQKEGSGFSEGFCEGFRLAKVLIVLVICLRMINIFVCFERFSWEGGGGSECSGFGGAGFFRVEGCGVWFFFIVSHRFLLWFVTVVHGVSRFF